MSGIKDAKRKKAKKRKQKQLSRIFYAVFSLLICIVLFVGVKALIDKGSNKSDSKSKTAAKKAGASDKVDTSKVKVHDVVIKTGKEKSSSSSDEPVTITVSSMGDCTLGTDEGFDQSKSLNAYYNAQGADYFFQNVHAILEKDDLSIVNMEGTLTTETTRAEKTYAFKADPEYASILSGSSVEAANLANNHSQDYGMQSYKDTKKHLKEAGIATFGYEHVDLFEVKGVKVGVTGIYELAEHLDKKTEVKENVTALKEAGAQIIIVNFHWGMERAYLPNDTQKELAHLAIDEGASLVIGHHPHVLQGIETYKGKSIAYSLGNFCFGGNSNPADKDSMIFQQTFTIKDKKAEDNAKTTIIPCSLSASSAYNDYCPTPLTGSEKERVEQKIEEYSQPL